MKRPGTKKHLFHWPRPARLKNIKKEGATIFWSRGIHSPGANDDKIGTGQCHKPVPLSSSPFGTGLWHDPVPMLKHWNRVVPQPGTQCLVPGLYRPRVPAAVAAGADASHWYRLKQQLVLLARMFSLFSSSVNSLFTILTSRERLRYFRGNMIILDKN